MRSATVNSWLTSYWRRAPGAVALALVLTCSVPTAVSDDSAAEPLRGELHAEQPITTPDRPIWVRFTIINTSDEVVELDDAAGDAVSLPLGIVFGDHKEPALSVVYGNDAPSRIPVAPPPANPQPRVLRLAPHAVIGTAINLRAHHQQVRYPGSYRVEWRPLGGRLGTLTTSFRVEPRKDAIIVTDHGKINCALDYDGAPRNVENFLDLIAANFYKGKTFHRVIPGSLIQGGCPKGDGTGTRQDGKLVPAELRPIPVEPGTIMMARKPSDPDSASCQFFIALSRQPDWDGQYTVIGQARDEESLRTLEEIASVPVDRRHKPVNPVIIRSISLVDAETDRSRRLEVQGGRQPRLSTDTQPAQDPPAKP